MRGQNPRHLLNIRRETFFFSLPRKKTNQTWFVFPPVAIISGIVFVFLFVSCVKFRNLCLSVCATSVIDLIHDDIHSRWLLDPRIVSEMSLNFLSTSLNVNHGCVCVSLSLPLSIGNHSHQAGCEKIVCCSVLAESWLTGCSRIVVGWREIPLYHLHSAGALLEGKKSEKLLLSPTLLSTIFSLTFLVAE